ncbi:hypothetical protein MTR67_005630, partial [Solanum verrucosum]
VLQNSEKFAIKKKTSLGCILLGDPSRKFITETNSCFRCLAFPEKLHTIVILSAVSGVFAHACFTGAPSGTTIARSYRKNAGAKELRRFAVKKTDRGCTELLVRTGAPSKLGTCGKRALFRTYFLGLDLATSMGDLLSGFSEKGVLMRQCFQLSSVGKNKFYSVSVDEFHLSFVLLFGGGDSLARKLELLMLFLISSIVKGEANVKSKHIDEKLTFHGSLGDCLLQFKDADMIFFYQRADPNFVMLTPTKEHLAEGINWKVGKRPLTCHFQSWYINYICYVCGDHREMDVAFGIIICFTFLFCPHMVTSWPFGHLAVEHSHL